MKLRARQKRFGNRKRIVMFQADPESGSALPRENTFDSPSKLSDMSISPTQRPNRGKILELDKLRNDVRRDKEEQYRTNKMKQKRKPSSPYKKMSVNFK